VISTDHLRAFALDPALVARVAAVHALGDVWAMGAAPQSAVATVILPRMEARLQGAWLDEVMGAAHDVFAEAGASVLGGHSSMGAELTVGFTVTGLLDRRR
jgi:selenide,water dikinase